MSLMPAVTPLHPPPARFEGSLTEVARGNCWRWFERAAGEALEAGRSPAATARELVLGDEISERGFADWRGLERALVSVGTIDAHHRGIAKPPGPTQLITAFSRTALLVRGLDGRNS